MANLFSGTRFGSHSKVGITEQTYYRWRKEYGGLRSEGAKKLKDLETENDCLKKLIAELSLARRRLAVQLAFGS